MIFCVLMNGEDFIAKIDGASRRVGFYVGRIVTADDQEEARSIAVEYIRQDLPPDVSASEQSRISTKIEDPDNANFELQTAFVFYSMEDESS